MEAKQRTQQSKKPSEGFFATTNDHLNQHGNSNPFNLPMGPYRADRIRQLLAARGSFTVSDMCAMHFDVHSRKAELFMNILRPLLPRSSAADRLRNRDLQYMTESEDTWRFEQFYEELHREVYRKGGLGEGAADALRQEAGAFIDFYHHFDRVLLSEMAGWSGGSSREDVSRQANQSFMVP